MSCEREGDGMIGALAIYEAENGIFERRDPR